MTTTEGARPAAKPIRSASNLRSYLIASLATGYVAVWWWLGAPARRGAAPSSAEPIATERSPQTVWLDELPSAARPAVSVPAGWHLADRAALPGSGRSPPARASIRASSTRPGRIRTRSS